MVQCNCGREIYSIRESYLAGGSFLLRLRIETSIIMYHIFDCLFAVQVVILSIR